MHENRHFLLYRKHCHDAENHVRMQYITLGSCCKMASNHRVADLNTNPVLISKGKDEAQMPLSVVGPLFISSLLLHLSQAVLGVWHLSLFHSIYSSFDNRLDLIQEPAFYCVFYFIFPIYPCLHILYNIYVKMKRFGSFKFNRLAISWPPWVRVWGWASYRFLPFTVFSLGLPFCFLKNSVQLTSTLTHPNISA